MTSSVEAVLLDIDDTLCEYRRSGSELLSVAFERVGVDPFFTDQEYTARYNDFTDDSENMQDLRERCFAAIASDCGHDPELGREVARVYAAERDHTNVRFCPGAQETLEQLSGTVPLAAVTNGAPEMQSAKLRTLGIDDRFETVVHAGYDAPAKPAPDPFHAALDALEVAPDRAVHVGNSLASDVAGAKNAGVPAAWLENDTPETQSVEPDYVLGSMAELPDLLR
jgi:HAD superfamily hydrolase (TIGR01509 family)